ncbi:MAG: alpha-L-fucosidase [Sedimentisphaerales bacterium]|nr:alpha-L-fucosidase [Sedimentisphaerales bacterium]
MIKKIQLQIDTPVGLVVLFVIFLLIIAATDAAPRYPTASRQEETQGQRKTYITWWREARFGMFIHWGPVSLTGLEISWSRANSNPACPNKGITPVETYDNLYKEFNPTKLDTVRWAGIAKSAGMKYIVLTAKHCDGFCLWHTKVSDYSMAGTPFGRDICAELSQAARKEGLRIGWYYSPMDWRDPDFRTAGNAFYITRMQQHLHELLSDYGKIDLLWFDWDGCEPLYGQATTYGLVRELQPRIIINNRLDLGPGDSDRKILNTNADYYTPEQSIGQFDNQKPWETCMTLGTQWAWKPNDSIKSLEECIEILIRCVGGDGNLLLNVGPMPTGEIEPRQVEVLQGIGRWLDCNGESIYSSRGGPYKPGPWGASTYRGNRIYLHILDWSDTTIRLPPLPCKITGSRLLNGGKALCRQDAESVEIAVDPKDRDSLDTVVVVEIEGSAEAIPPIHVPSMSLATGKKVIASNVYQNIPLYSAAMALDDDGDTRWATDSGIKQAWLQINLERSTAFNRVIIKEAYPNRIQRFQLEKRDGDSWKPFFEGETVGERGIFDFEMITAHEVRFNILDATDGPTIWEFALIHRK